jgi:hypothetical protein
MGLDVPKLSVILKSLFDRARQGKSFRLALIVVLAGITACSQNEQNFILLKESVVGTLLYDFEGINYDVAGIQRTKDGMMFFDDKNQRLHFFGDNGEHLHATSFHKEGKDQVEEIAAVYYHSSDSIFLARLGYFSIYLINSAGEKVNQWDFDYDYPIPGTADFYSGTFGVGGLDRYGVPIVYSPFVGLIADFHPVVYDQDNGFPERYKLPTTAVLDLIDNKPTPFGAFAEEYQSDNIPHDLFVSFSVNYPYVILNYPSSHHFAAYHLENRSTTQILGRSKFLKDKDFIRYAKKDGGEVSDFWEDYNRKPQYVKTISDPISKNLYRIVKHSNPEAIPAKDFLESSWSIIKFSSNFTYLGEAELPSYTYNFLHVFSLADTLHISKMNPFSQSLDEDTFLIEKIVIQ